MKLLLVSSVVLLLLFAITQETEGKCLVGCMAKFFLCKRRQEATGNELLECCAPYMECAKDCGIINPSCGKDIGNKRGSWNKRFDMDDYDTLGFPFL